MNSFSIWNGSQNCYIDKKNITQNGSFYIGNFGGCSSSGAFTNEDGLMYMESPNNWRFAVIMDAHATYESIILMSELLIENTKAIWDICNEDLSVAIPELNNFITSIIIGKEAYDKSKSVKGETAVLFCFEKDGYLWWLSVGDNSLYVFHKEYNELGQYRLNQRVFYQWYGEKNSLALEVPCYSSGTIQLRKGKSTIVMLTDGVLEIKNRLYEDSSVLSEVFENNHMSAAIDNILTEVETQKGRDSATVIAWTTCSTKEVLRPTKL